MYNSSGQYVGTDFAGYIDQAAIDPNYHGPENASSGLTAVYNRYGNLAGAFGIIAGQTEYTAWDSSGNVVDTSALLEANGLSAAQVATDAQGDQQTVQADLTSDLLLLGQSTLHSQGYYTVYSNVYDSNGTEVGEFGNYGPNNEYQADSTFGETYNTDDGTLATATGLSSSQLSNAAELINNVDMGRANGLANLATLDNATASVLLSDDAAFFATVPTAAGINAQPLLLAGLSSLQIQSIDVGQVALIDPNVLASSTNFLTQLTGAQQLSLTASQLQALSLGQLAPLAGLGASQWQTVASKLTAQNLAQLTNDQFSQLAWNVPAVAGCQSRRLIVAFRTTGFGIFCRGTRAILHRTGAGTQYKRLVVGSAVPTGLELSTTELTNGQISSLLRLSMPRLSTNSPEVRFSR